MQSQSPMEWVFMITLTDNAIREYKRQLSADDKSGHAVRFGLRPGGCAGTKYLIEFTTTLGDDDHVFEQDGLRVVCDAISLTSLRGLRVDFVEALVGGGFQYQNPNATINCNCGKSFGTAETLRVIK